MQEVQGVQEDHVPSEDHDNCCPAHHRGGIFRSSNPKVPESTTTPPIPLPCPPNHFVRECITIDAPCSIGRVNTGLRMCCRRSGVYRYQLRFFRSLPSRQHRDRDCLPSHKKEPWSFR